MNALYRVSILFFIMLFSFQGFTQSASLGYLNGILSFQERKLDRSIERMSSGRILLTDDPANYAIFSRIEAYIRQFEKQISGAKDMINYYIFLDGALENGIDIIHRMKDLSLMRQGGILSDFEREIIGDEIGYLGEQIIKTLKQAEFNQRQVFGDVLADARFGGQAMAPTPEYLDSLLEFFIRERTIAGTMVNRLDFTVSGDAVANENARAFQSRGDTDMGKEISNFKRDQVLLLIKLMALGTVTIP